MNLLCHVSGHVAAPLVLENQGFLFSRCHRCRRDLIRSARESTDASPGNSWTAVPGGLRVAWRSADVSAFDHPSWLARSWHVAHDRGRRSSAAVTDAVKVAFAVLCWRAADAARRARAAARAAYSSGRRVIRLPRPSWPGRHHAGIVIINLTLAHEPGLWRDDRRSAVAPFGL